MSGEKIPFDKIEHQHLSNILWYKEVLCGSDSHNDDIHFVLSLEIDIRFYGKRLPWKPLPVSGEIAAIRLVAVIIGNDIMYNGVVIGSISHIK